METYKSIENQETKETFSFEVVESAARVVVGYLMERAKNKSSKRKDLRTTWCKAFHVDSLAILSANKTRLTER